VSDLPSLLTAAACVVRDRGPVKNSNFLSSFLENTVKNIDKVGGATSRHGIRHCEAVKDFCVHILHWGGAKVYEQLESNFGTLPAVSTVKLWGRTVYVVSPGMTDEGMQFAKVYFGDGTLFWACEDGTRQQRVFEAHNMTGATYGWVNKDDPFDVPVPHIGSWEELEETWRDRGEIKGVGAWRVYSAARGACCLLMGGRWVKGLLVSSLGG